MDKITKEARSRVMSAIRSKHTKPEVVLRRMLWEKGYRYRLHYGREKIDIAFPGRKIAIFVDGCFWHQCPMHSHVPKSNMGYWVPKLKKNKLRAKKKDARLRAAGWKVLHVWEHELEDSKKVLKKIERILGS